MMRSDHIMAVILAGGQSRRMGVPDKCLLSLRGRVILDHVLDRIRPQVKHIAISANGDLGRFAAWGLPMIGDVIPGWRGPLVGILSAMEWAREHLPTATELVTIPADMPFLPLDLVRKLSAGRVDAGRDAAVGMSDGRLNPLIGLWPISQAPALRSAILDQGVAKADLWVRQNSVALVRFFNTDIDPFFNINNADDLASAEGLLADKSS